MDRETVEKNAESLSVLMEHAIGSKPEDINFHLLDDVIEDEEREAVLVALCINETDIANDILNNGWDGQTHDAMGHFLTHGDTAHFTPLHVHLLSIIEEAVDRHTEEREDKPSDEALGFLLAINAILAYGSGEYDKGMKSADVSVGLTSRPFVAATAINLAYLESFREVVAEVEAEVSAEEEGKDG